MIRLLLLVASATATMLGASGWAHADRVSSGCVAHRHEANQAPDLRGFTGGFSNFAMP